MISNDLEKLSATAPHFSAGLFLLCCTTPPFSLNSIDSYISNEADLKVSISGTVLLRSFTASKERMRSEKIKLG